MPQSLLEDELQKKTYLKYSGLSLPRYTSYPSIPNWKEQAHSASSLAHIESTRLRHKALSLYFHVPFCQKLCFYCGCQKEIMHPSSASTQRTVDDYLKGLEFEVLSLAPMLKDCLIEQLHFGGGTPNFLNRTQWRYLYDKVLSKLNLSKTIEWSVELDPRTVSNEQLEYLSSIGVNRVSLGIQDFDDKVQKAVNRVQSFELVESVVSMCRRHGIAFINFDLIYGLPFQTVASMQKSLDMAISLAPDRIAYYRLAVLPQMFRAQKSFIDKNLPEGMDSLALNLLGIDNFLAAGYEFIGLDHFAKHSDPLAVAARKNLLQRNFQGMTSGASLPLLGFGPSAISMLDDIYIQNPKTTHDWLLSLENPESQRKAHILTPDDRIRRDIINQIFCLGSIDKKNTELRFGINFDQYFVKELQKISPLIDDRLVIADTQSLQLTNPLGQLLRRVVAATFDAYLPETAFQAGLGRAHRSQVG
ncbi:MAG: oxygen-independent coproporphyrinogen III oxidase [Proteobacteria bacterium]|nr:oxygen-independent coproporphyrinogen III oxidase [Pseudomonadota bacterium]